MSISPSDNGYALVAETTAGTTPATPAFFNLDYTPNNDLEGTSDWLESPALAPNRGNRGGRKVSYSVAGSLAAHLFRDPAIDLLLESGFSGEFTSDVLKGSATDKSFTVEKTMINGSTTLYNHLRGCQVASTTITGEASGNVEASFDIVGMSHQKGESGITGATYTNAASTLKLAGPDVTASIAGVTVDFTSFELTVEFERSAQYSFGSTAARGVGTGNKRMVTGNLSFYRDDWSPEAVFDSDDGAALTITVGSGANGYTFLVPAAQFRLPSDGEDNNSVIASVEFTGADDATAGTNVQVTRLS